MNLYQYVKNNPTINLDPKGTDYMRVEDQIVWWTIEKRGWNNDYPGSVRVGTYEDGWVYVGADFGDDLTRGCVLRLSDVKRAARNFWNEYNDISGNSYMMQKAAVQGVLGQLCMGDALDPWGDWDHIVGSFFGGAGEGIGNVKGCYEVLRTMAVLQIFQYNQWEGRVQNDKFAHCFFSCRLNQECGVYAQEIFGMTKEVSDLIGGFANSLIDALSYAVEDDRFRYDEIDKFMEINFDEALKYAFADFEANQVGRRIAELYCNGNSIDICLNRCEDQFGDSKAQLLHLEDGWLVGLGASVFKDVR